MQTRQTTTKRTLIVPCKLRPGQQKHGTMRELRRDQRPGNHQQLLVRVGMQGQKGFGLNAESERPAPSTQLPRSSRPLKQRPVVPGPFDGALDLPVCAQSVYAQRAHMPN